MTWANVLFNWWCICLMNQVFTALNAIHLIKMAFFCRFLQLCRIFAIQNKLRDMALIKSYKGLSPRWGEGCYFSENATIVGDVRMGDQCSVWFNAVVRGDVAPITIGDRTNVQDGACIHVTHETGPTHIGNDVTIGHNATVHACNVHDDALIGMGATLLDNCEVGEGAIVAAGALVLQGTKIPPYEIWGGVPAKFIKNTRPGQADNAAHYVKYAQEYLNEG